MKASTLLCITALLAGGCTGERDPSSSPPVPGEPVTLTTRVLDAGAALLQDKPPIDAINAYLDGFHFYNGKMSVQMEAHHYCTNLNEEVIQCVIYDGRERSARLMGLEYIISARLFAQLPTAEKSLWHSHVHEVKSGQLVAPGIPEVVERQLMKRLMGTYGKTWHTWHASQAPDASQHGSHGTSLPPAAHSPDAVASNATDALPLGVPQLMMGFTADGQADPGMVARRDATFGIDSAGRRERRSGIPSPGIDTAADAWEKGNHFQIRGPGAETDPHPSSGR
jgi:hypothetical protein